MRLREMLSNENALVVWIYHIYKIYKYSRDNTDKEENTLGPLSMNIIDKPYMDVFALGNI